MHLRVTQRRRDGNSLVLFTLTVFVLLAVAGLTIDLGIALATRHQLQSAVDTAALEALRERDSEADATRRQDASNLALLSQTVGLDPVTASLAFSGGINTGTPFLASQLVTVVYGSPAALYPNEMNDRAGDMVSGKFLPAGLGIEGNDYVRDDFQPDGPGATRPGSAFLVRMRRTGEPGSAGVSSSGPPYPYLFARGSLLNPITKAQGIAVRATAIADARPVMSVGQPAVRPQLHGVTPFVLFKRFWDSLEPDNTITLPDDLLGTATARNVGYPFTPQSVIALGQRTAPNGEQLDLSRLPVVLYRYVPIIAPLPSSAGGTVDRIVGFGRVDVRKDGPTDFQITKRVNMVASDNASTALMIPLDDVLRNDANQLKALFQAQQSLLTSSLLAPALVR